MPGAGIFGNLLAQQPRTPESFIADRQANEASGLTNALSAAKLDEYQQGLLRDSKLRNMLASGAGSDQLIQGGFLKEGMDLSKNKADVGNINSQEASHRVKAFADKAAVMRSSIGSVPNPQAAARYMQQAFADPDMGPVMKQFGTLEEALSEIPNDPNGFRNWQMQASEGIGKLADHAMKQQQLDATIRGQDLSAATQRRWQDIQQGNNIRSNERMSANAGGGAGGVANAGGAPAKPAKPLPVAALKMQQDSLDAIGTAGGINADLGAVLQQVESGSLQLGPVKNAVGSVRNTLGVSNENSQNLATFKATLEKLRNDSLRLNKGVQTDGDAQRAWNELLSNINDPGVVAKRLKEIRSINSRAIELHNDNLGNIRSNYGAQPIDTTKRATQKPAIESAVKRINSDDEYNALPSGATFIAPDGKTRRKP